MPQFQPFDYGRAIQQGTQNALSALQARQGINTLKRNRAIRQTGQQAAADGSYSFDEHANALRKMGYVQAANTLTQQAHQNRSNRISTALEGMQFIAATAPMARDQQSYEQVVSRWQELGLVNPGELPEQYDPTLLRSLQGKAEDRLSASDLVKVMVPGADGEPRAAWVRADQAIGLQPYQEPDSGMSFSVGPDGTVHFTQGGEGLIGKTDKEASGDQFSAQKQLARLRDIREQFDPSYLEVPTRFVQGWNALAEKLSITDLTEDEKGKLRQFTQFKQSTLRNLNLVIRALSGAAMTVQEAERIKPTLPNAGTGLLDGDSPTQFKAKLDNATAMMEASIRRLQYLRSEGFVGEDGKINSDLAQQFPLSQFMPGNDDQSGVIDFSELPE